MSTPPLESTARTLVAPGRGILAADESHSTIEKRFSSIGEHGREPPGLPACSSPPRGGRRGMIPGIKVDKDEAPRRRLRRADPRAWTAFASALPSTGVSLHAYMIRLKPEDFATSDRREALARAAKLTEPEFVKRFGCVVGEA